MKFRIVMTAMYGMAATINLMRIGEPRMDMNTPTVNLIAVGIQIIFIYGIWNWL